ncbi:MAG: TldD/PmbA family protein [Theionarchaea archaeon]|nr:TldD/PmbA family protein [Theionarchaea archaeon]
MNDGFDLVEYGVDFAEQQGASYAEARFINRYNENYILRNGSVIGVLETESSGIGIRVISNGGVAFGSTDQLTKQNVEDTVLRAIRLAKLAHRKDPVVFSAEKFEETKWNTPVKQDFQEISKEDKLQFFKTVEKRQKKEAGKALKNRLLYLDMLKDNKYYMNNEGAKIESKNSVISLFGYFIARVKNRTEQRQLALGAAKGWEWIKEQNVEDHIILESQALVKTTEHATSYEFQNPADVVVSGEVAGIMCHENVGHPSEADRILGREGAQAGESFYKDLWEGDFQPGKIRIGADCVTVIDDPTYAENAGYYVYDDEGVKAHPRHLIKNGMLNDLLMNREYAARFNCTSSAASRAFGYNREPITRMANTYMAPGDFEEEELFEDITEGLYMKSFTEWNIDDRRFQSKYVGLECYLIRNGELTSQQIRRPILELTTFGIFQNVDAVDKGHFTPYGACGKGDPMQTISVSMGGAHFRIRNVRVGGGL